MHAGSTNFCSDREDVLQSDTPLTSRLQMLTAEAQADAAHLFQLLLNQQFMEADVDDTHATAESTNSDRGRQMNLFRCAS